MAAEQELSAGWAEGLAHNPHVPILQLTRDGRLLAASAGAHELMGFRPELGQPLDAILNLSPSETESLLASRGIWRGQGALLRGEALPIGVRLEADGHAERLTVLLMVDVEPLIDLQESFGAINSQLTNLTRERAKQNARLALTLAQLQAANAELDALNQELVEVERLKSRFYADMNHELRTPLNSIIGFAEDALDGLSGPLTPPVEHAFATILRSGRQQLALIADLLDLAQLAAGQLTLVWAAFDLRELVEEVTGVMVPLFARKSQPFERDLPLGALGVTGDRAKLFQVLLNLLSNAHKYTPPGTRIRVSVNQDSTATHVCVADEGPGIEAGDLARIFDEFYQPKPLPGTVREQGTGLGLAISKTLVELHGGRIAAHSEVGRGAVFSFSWPRKIDSESG